MNALHILNSMAALQGAQEAAEALIARACDPRVGDRFIGLDGITTVEITALIDDCVIHTHSRFESPLSMSRQLFIRLAKTAILGGHTFHAVEDDEE